MTIFINKPALSRDLTISIISFISSFEITNNLVPGPNIFFRKPASTTDDVVVNLNSLSNLLASDLSTILTDSKAIFNNHPRSLPRNLTNSIVLHIFDLGNLNLILKLFTRKITSSFALPIIFSDIRKVISALFYC